MRKASIILCMFIMTAVVVPFALSAETVGTAAEKKGITLDLKDVDIRSALESMFRGTGNNYAIDPNVSGIVTSVSFKDVPFDTALKNLLKTHGLVYRLDQGIYIISNRPETEAQAVPPSSATPSAAGAGPDDTTKRSTTIDKIPLNFTSATEILAIMGSGGGNYDSGFGNRYGFGQYGGGGYGGIPGYGGGGYGGYGGGNPGGGYGYGGNRGYGGYGGSQGYGGYRGW